MRGGGGPSPDTSRCFSVLFDLVESGFRAQGLLCAQEKESFWVRGHFGGVNMSELYIILILSDTMASSAKQC